MEKTDIFEWVKKTYNVEPDYPWNDKNAVLRHGENRKWFGVVMEIPESRLGLPGERIVSVMNLKCDPILIGSLRKEKGFFPAYHMSKDGWISILLDDSEFSEQIKNLIDLSFDLTLKK